MLIFHCPKDRILPADHRRLVSCEAKPYTLLIYARVHRACKPCARPGAQAFHTKQGVCFDSTYLLFRTESQFGKGGIYLRKTKQKTFSRKSKTISLLLALLMIASTVSVGLATLASATAVDDDSGGLAETGAAAYDEINVPTIANGSENAFWVNATYYDYLSDAEKTNGWLNPIQAGTDYSGASNDWYEFYSFNNRIHEATFGTGVYPLYFGNFCNSINYGGSGSDSYSGTSYDLKYNGNTLDASYDANHGGPYEHAMSYTHNNDNNHTKLYNYEYFINNSNGLKNYHYSVTGLAENNLSDTGSIKFKNGGEMPYFNSSWLRDSSRQIGQVINSQFPFRETPINDKVTYYSFDSEDATDNVYFNWSGKTPTAVGYGTGTGYGVRDGIQYFMNPDDKDPDTDQPYKNKKYYGIFPFNRASGSNGGNNKLDYGFGIKMNMDFRVTKNGTIDESNSNDVNKAIKFTYTGDDDLWVYITPYNDDGQLDWSNSQLVLDLGGSHKKATGNINFHTMTATVNAAKAATRTYFRPDTIYIVNNGTKSNSTPFNDLKVWAWTENADGSSKGDGTWVNVGRQDDYYTVKASDMAGRNKFIVSQGNWERQSAEDSRRASGYYGNVTYTDNLEWITEQREEASGSTKKFGFESDGNGGYKTLDPDKTYHMTVFYMERGMIESNCSMGFTMTPVKNDFKVSKTVNVDQINTGLQSAIQAMNYSFTTTEDDSVRKNTTYFLGGNSYAVDQNSGVYQLKHGQTADFLNQHRTGSALSVSETTPAGLTYTTTWNVVNNKKGNQLINGRGLTTDTFNLLDPNNNSAPADLQANFVNMPTPGGDITLAKMVFENEADIFDNDDGDNINVDDEFSFRILVNLNGNPYSATTAREFIGYDLAYTVKRGNQTIPGTATGGAFSVKTGDKITISGMPVGATYCLEELGCDGYSPVAYSEGTNAKERFSGNAIVNETVGSDDDAWIFYNVEGVASKPFEVEKYIQANNTRTQYKNGNLFTFRAKGLGSVEYAQGKTSVDATAQTRNGTKDYIEVNTVNAQGKAIFQNNGDDDPFLQFRQAGVYIFEVEESAVSGDFADAITKSSQKFLVKYTIETDGTGLKPSDATPEYFTYDGSAISAATFSANNKVNVPQFVNNTKVGKVIVNKTDGNNAALDGVIFTLYVKNGDDLTAVESKTTTGGKVTFENLDVFAKTNGTYTGAPAKITYVLKETQTKNGHYQEKTVKEFQFGINGQYEYTFDYVNGALKQPDTGMFDVFHNIPLGIALIFLAFVSIGLFIAQLKKKQLAAPRINRFL